MVTGDRRPALHPSAERRSGRWTELAEPQSGAEMCDREKSDLGPSEHEAQLMLHSGRIIEGQLICRLIYCNNLYLPYPVRFSTTEANGRTLRPRSGAECLAR